MPTALHTRGFEPGSSRKERVLQATPGQYAEITLSHRLDRYGREGFVPSLTFHRWGSSRKVM